MMPLTTRRGVIMALKKLTSNTRWDEIDGEVYIFARKPGDQKWSKAFTCHPATIDLIKREGLREAVSRSLLIPCKK
ncbi:hypothetical protein bas59_0120 [Escherichia phage EduardKellenberger]|uniref:Uncharacterized protein n=1 Tax=Escherichia phage EduardKellenberger TaxID=2852031 RepID=A0ABX8SP34_9CAUD|nr:hypothetical protein bas59_0120 [Escherichia phage EduardKellenberger]